MLSKESKYNEIAIPPIPWYKVVIKAEHIIPILMHVPKGCLKVDLDKQSGL
jgi:hypothetical protein